MQTINSLHAESYGGAYRLPHAVHRFLSNLVRSLQIKTVNNVCEIFEYLMA